MLFSVEKSNPLMYETYKNLSTNIQYSSETKDVKSILITSATKSEGKSTIAANLAYVMAKSNKKVLLIDADLRNSSLHKLFNIKNNKGLKEIVTENLEFNKAIQNIEGNLYLMTSGATDKVNVELLSSPKFSEMLIEANKNFDYIILDSSDMLLQTDSKILSTKVDATILVIRSGKSDRNKAKLAKEELKRVNANVIGVVLNEVAHEILQEKGYI
ncbi:MAG: CpsD/CapB family tyrosine-protein kinase [Clostridium sp.]